jgi:hypothetical protein
MMEDMTPSKSGMSASCPCGASLDIDPNETTQEIACPECGMTLEVAVAIDSRTKQVRLGILVKPTAVTHRAAKGKGVEVHTAKCVCGALITVESNHVDELYTCSSCDADYTAVLKKPKSGGMSTLVLRPLVAAPVTKKMPGAKPAAKVPAARPAPPSPPKVFAKAPPTAAQQQPSGAGLAAKEKLLQMTKGDVGAQEFKDGRISCFCRATIELKDGNPREIVKCPECGTGFRIFQATHPKTGEAMAVMIPRG